MVSFTTNKKCDILRVKLEVKKMEKEMVNPCRYQVLFCVKYKKEVLIDDVKESLQQLIMNMESGLEMKILQLEVESYYVKMLLEIDDKVAISKVVYQIKRLTSGELKKRFPHLKSKLPNLWTGETYIKTIGTEVAEEIDEYLKKQKTRKEEKNENK